MEYKATICPYCGCGCGIYLVIEDGKIVGVEPWKEHPVNEGKNCIKGKNAYQFLYSPERLTTPLIRGDDGSFREASWDEALELVAAKLKATPPDLCGFIASGKTTNEDGYVLQKFARTVMQTNNIEYCARFCHAATVAGLSSTVGSGVMPSAQEDIAKADCIIMAGVNIKETFPMLARRVMQARKNGARVITIDPRHTITARFLTDLHLCLTPGTDVLIINAMMKVILDEGLANASFIAEKTEGFEELREHLAGFDLEEAVRITGVPLDSIRSAAVAYAQAKNGSILYDEGITQHTTGSDNVKALADLALLTGHFGKPGSGVNSLRGQINGEGTGDMGCMNVNYPGFKKVGEENAKIFKELWGVDNLPTKPGMTYLDLLKKCSTVYIVGSNTALSGPDAGKVQAVLSDCDFLVVQDIYLTETARLAKVVLPTATWVEREGTHTWVDRRVQKIDKLVDAPGDARPDWWIFCRLAEKMGYGRLLPFKGAKEIFEEIRRCVPQYKGITYERLENCTGGIQWPCPSEDHPGTPTMFAKGFPTASGRAHFQPVTYRPPAEGVDESYPYQLTTGRSIFHFHTGTMTRRTPKLTGEISECFVEVNPSDAVRENIRQGDRVAVATRRGSIDVTARVTREVPEGLLFVPFHFADGAANVLTNPALDPVCKIPEFKVCAARLEAKA